MRGLRSLIIGSVACGIAAALVVSAAAGNTKLWSSRQGDLTFPFTPPTASAPGLIDNMTIGATTPRPATITNLVVTGTVSGASLNSLTSPGPIGSVTPGTGAFTTLSASGAVSGAGFTALLAAPPAIGGTTPAAGAFTTLSASGAVSGAGFTALLASPPAIGGTAPAAGSFTTLTNTGHVITGSTAPTPSACGTGSPAVVGSDRAGEVTLGTGTPTGCVVTFASAYVSAPFCTVTWQANLASMGYTVSNTAITLTQTATSSNKVNYTCVAQAGG